MKFGQVIEYSIRNIYVEKSYTKYGGKAIPKNSSKNFLKDSKGGHICG